MEPDPFTVNIVNDVQPRHTHNSNIEQPMANFQSSTFLDTSLSLDNHLMADDVLLGLSYGIDLPGPSYAKLVDEPFNLFDDPSMPLGLDTIEIQEPIAQDDLQSSDNLLHCNDMAIATSNNSHLPMPVSPPDFTPINHPICPDFSATIRETITSNSWPVIGSSSQFSTSEQTAQSISSSEESSSKALINGAPQQFSEISSMLSMPSLEPFEQILPANSTDLHQPPPFIMLRPKPMPALDGASSFPFTTNATESVDVQYGPKSDSSLNVVQQFSLPSRVKGQQRIDGPSNSGASKVRKVNIARSKPPAGVPSKSVVVWDSLAGSSSKKESWKRRPDPCLLCKLSKKRVSSAVKLCWSAFGNRKAQCNGETPCSNCKKAETSRKNKVLWALMKDFMPFEPSSLCFAGDFRPLRLEPFSGTLLERIKLHICADIVIATARLKSMTSIYVKYCTFSVAAGTSSTPTGFVPCFTFQFKPVSGSSHPPSEQIFDAFKGYFEDPSFPRLMVNEWLILLHIQRVFFESSFSSFFDDIYQAIEKPIPDYLDVDVADICDRAPHTFARVFADLYALPRIDATGASKLVTCYRSAFMALLWYWGWLTPLDPQDNTCNYFVKYLEYWYSKLAYDLKLDLAGQRIPEPWIYEYTIHERAISVMVMARNVKRRECGFGNLRSVLTATMADLRYNLFLPRGERSLS